MGVSYGRYYRGEVVCHMVFGHRTYAIVDVGRNRKVLIDIDEKCAVVVNGHVRIKSFDPQFLPGPLPAIGSIVVGVGAKPMHGALADMGPRLAPWGELPASAVAPRSDRKPPLRRHGWRRLRCAAIRSA